MEKRTRGRPKTVNRSEILEITMHAYWNEGVRNISLNEICRRTGISKPGLYREFDNEDGLVVAALDNYHKNVLLPMLSVLSSEVSLEMAVQGLYKLYKEDKERPKGCLFVKMLEVHDSLGAGTNKLIRKIKKQSLEAYQAWAQSLKKKGEIRAGVSADFAGKYIDAQFNNAFALVAQGEKLDDAIKILNQSLKAISTI